MICPKCERPTYRYTRERLTRNGERIRHIPAGTPSGALLAATPDGKCYTCHRREDCGTAWNADGSGRYRAIRFTEEELQQTSRTLRRYVAGRRRRQVPSSGVPVESLRKPGLFSWEVR